jgi:hypothetical protein
MTKFFDKLRSLEQEIADEKGPFQFYALILREDSPLKWDLVVAAPWLDEDERAGMKYLAAKVTKVLTKKEVVRMLAGIVIVERDNPGLKPIQKTVAVEHGNVELRDCELFRMDVEHAIIITSIRPGARHAGKAG